MPATITAVCTLGLLVGCTGAMSGPPEAPDDEDAGPRGDASPAPGTDAAPPSVTDAARPPIVDVVCGDDACAGETCATCPDDCGACPLPPDTEPAHPDSPLHDLMPGQWLEVAGSHLEDVSPPGWSGEVIQAWSGGVYDTRRHRLVLFGGGHNKYSGNELYAFDLDELAWERLTDPADPYCRASWGSSGGGCVGIVNPDGTPISRHTYGGISYHHGLDALYARGGAPDSSSGGCGARGVWFYYFTRGEWVLYEDDVDSGPQLGCELKSAYDPIADRVVHRSDGYFSYEIDPGCTRTNADFGSDSTGGIACPGRWVRLGASPSGLRRGFDISTRSYIHANGAFYEIGDNERAATNSNGVGSNVWRIDPNDGYSRTALDTVGDNACTAAANPGVAYHAPSNRIVCWIGGSDIYSLPLDGSLSWERHRYSGTVAPPQVTASGGTYGRFRYSPVYDVFVMVNAIDENVFIYRMPSPL